MSLGGSLIIPDSVDTGFLKKFRKIIRKYTSKYKFVIVCGGGSIARKYITSLKSVGINKELQSMAGISTTRANARFMAHFFGQELHQGVPHSKRQVFKLLKKQDVVFCGALEYQPDQTTDATGVDIAEYFGSFFINLTNVKGLYTKNPKKFKSAKFIPKISWKEFNKMARKSKFQPGQHFVLDQSAAKMILEDKTPTYIVGSLKQLENILKNKKFIGTVVEG